MAKNSTTKKSASKSAKKSADEKKKSRKKSVSKAAAKKSSTARTKKAASAKKSTKTTAKKTASAKKSSASKTKKTTDAKKATAKRSTSKKTTKPKSTKTTTTRKKTTMAKSPKKTTTEKKITKPRTKKKVEESLKAPVQEGPSPAEIRAKALQKIKGYSKKDLEHFKTIILEKRDEILEQLQNLKEQMLDPTTGEYINENSPYSLHMAEQGTDAMEREKTFLYAQRENKFLGYLEDALKRIEAGTYGICIECIEEPQHLCETCPLIPKARLEAVPHSQLCLPIKQRQEKR